MIRLVPYNNRRNELSSFMDDFFDTSLRRFENESTFKMDIIEKDNLYIIDAEMPGINKEDIEIELDEGRLSLSVNHVEESEEKEDNKFIHRERSQRSMQRSVYLGEIDEENIQASLKDGILEVIVPKKKEEDTRKKIEIN